MNRFLISFCLLFGIPFAHAGIDGHYLATLTTLNPHVNGNIPASVTMQRIGKKVYAYVRVFGGGVRVWHQQNIFLGNRCPDLADDLNFDGFIDIEEGNLVWGKVIIPLDGELKTQKGGKNIYPLSDAFGSYYYEQVAKHKKIMKDLHQRDEFLTDQIVKLGKDEDLVLDGKVVVIQGVSKNVVLPETVATNGGRKAFQTLPILCGTFNKVVELPGKPYDGKIPGPVGPVEPRGGLDVLESHSDQY